MQSASSQMTFCTPDSEPFFMEELPESILKWMSGRAEWVRAQTTPRDGQSWIVSEVLQWEPGETLRVAFRGGAPDLHEKIAKTVATIEACCNIKFDFGFDEATRLYRSWSEADSVHRAEIRVSFDQKGYFSLVGTDSADKWVGHPSGPVGGGPGQRSLNLGGFDVNLPYRWRGTVIHEFMHAIAFQHEHQNLQGPCQDEFRWDDDLGYVETKDNRGAYVTDSSGRRPGIYTYLSGYPNNWSRAKVDHNLRPLSAPVVTGAFDRASVMLYRFPELFYKNGANSACGPVGDGQSLSDGDIAGLQRLYPATDVDIVRRAERVRVLRDALARDRKARSGDSPFDWSVESVLARRT